MRNIPDDSKGTEENRSTSAGSQKPLEKSVPRAPPSRQRQPPQFCNLHVMLNRLGIEVMNDIGDQEGGVFRLSDFLLLFLFL